MKRILICLSIAAVTLPANAHFIWLVPTKDGAVQMVFSDDLDPDENVSITKIAQTDLFARTSSGEVKVARTQAKNHFRVTFSATGDVELGGICHYGVIAKRGDPFLLNYYPKVSVGCATRKKLGTRWSRLPLEIVCAPGSKTDFHVLWNGKPTSEVEVAVIMPGAQKSRKLTLKKNGTFNIGPISPDSKGPLGIRARFIEKKQGEFKGAKYKEVRHYATWTFQPLLPK